VRKPRAIQLGLHNIAIANLPTLLVYPIQKVKKKKNTFPSRKLKKTVAVAIKYPPQHNILSSGTSFIAVVCENVFKKLIFFYLIYLKNIFTIPPLPQCKPALQALVVVVVPSMALPNPTFIPRFHHHDVKDKSLCPPPPPPSPFFQ
jgi:hypothetical protein